MPSSEIRVVAFFLPIVAVAAAPFLSPCPSAEPTAQRPNIVFIMTDQQHVGMMSCADNASLKTPAMDSLARDGIRFERAYVANPVCVPSRISMATGMMPGRLGVFSNGMKAIVPDEVNKNSLGTLIQRAGYDCFYGGKVHLCPELNPPNAGYDVVDRDQRESLPDACIEFLRRKRDRPFFAVASFINPHDICLLAGEKTPLADEIWKRYQPPEGAELPPVPDNFESTRG